MHMHPRAAYIVLMFTLLAVISPSYGQAAVDGQDAPKKQQSAKKKADSGTSLTGCIDEQDGKYVLLDDKSAVAIADLEAVGFPTEGFAKHVGHKVTVKGTSNPGGARPLIKVRNIETISEMCTPPQQGKV